MSGGDYPSLTSVVPGAIPASSGRDVRDSVLLRFASAAARDTLPTGLGPAHEGMAAYLTDSRLLTMYPGSGTAWKPYSGQLIARGNRSTNSSTTTTEIGVLRLDSVPIVNGVVYELWTSPVFV